MNTIKERMVHSAIIRRAQRRRARQRDILRAIAATATAAKLRQVMAIKAVAAFAISRKTAEGPPRFRAVAYNGGPLKVGNCELPVIVDLAGLVEDPQGVHVNLDHQDEARVGHIDAVGNTGRRLILSDVVSGASAAAREFLESFRAKYPTPTSKSTRPHRLSLCAKVRPRR